MDQEAKTAAFFQAHGFLVKRDLKIAIESTPVDATDIDVFAIRFTEPFNEEKIVVDCKDKRKPRPFERVLWTSGLKKACEATRAIVVLPQAPWQAFAFAQNQNVELLKEEIISSFLLNEKDFSPYGDAIQETIENERKYREQLLEHDKDLVRDNHRLRSMLLTGHPLTNFNAIINILSRLNEKFARNSFAFSWYYRMVAFNGAVIAAVMLLRFIAEVKWLDEKDWRDYARKKLTYGDTPVQKAVSLARTAFGEEFFDGLPAPHYCAEVLDLVAALMNKRSMVQLPVLVDRFLFGFLITGRDYRDQFEKSQYRPIKQLLSVLSYASGMSIEFWTQPLAQAASGSSPLKTTAYNPKKQYSKRPQTDAVSEPSVAFETDKTMSNACSIEAEQALSTDKVGPADKSTIEDLTEAKSVNFQDVVLEQVNSTAPLETPLDVTVQVNIEEKKEGSTQIDSGDISANTQPAAENHIDSTETCIGSN